MPISYDQLIHDAAIRMNALVGSQVVALEATYVTSPLTAANFKSADWPFSAFKDAVLFAEETIINAIANNPNSPYRSKYDTVSPALVSGSALPQTNSSGNPIVGVPGVVTDSSDSKPLTRESLARVKAFIDDAWRLYPVYFYAIEGWNIFHTRSLVLVRVCTYNRSLSASAMASSTTSTCNIPDSLEPIAAALMVSMMAKDGAFTQQAEYYRNIADAGLAQIRGGT
jgi:hypothetical protein